MNSPILVACAHGTSSPHGVAAVNALRTGIAALRRLLRRRGLLAGGTR